MPLPLSAFPEFQALQHLCDQVAARVRYLEEQLPEWVDALEAQRLTNLSLGSLRRVRERPGSLIVYEKGRYKRESLLAHNDSRTIRKAILSEANHFHILPKPLMNQVIDLTQYTEFQELEQRYHPLLTRIDEVERKLPEWVDKAEARRITGVSDTTLWHERKDPKSIIVWKSDCGVHYQRASLLAYNELRAKGRPRGRRQS